MSHKAVFKDGVAQIIEITESGEEKVIIWQPFKPGFNGPEQWQDEKQALAWLELEYPQFFIKEQPQTESDVGAGV